VTFLELRSSSDFIKVISLFHSRIIHYFSVQRMLCSFASGCTFA